MITNQIKKGEKNNITLSQKSEKGQNFFDKNAIKMKEVKIKILTHELLVFTLLSKTSPLVIHQSFKSLFTDSSSSLLVSKHINLVFLQTSDKTIVKTSFYKN
jgi:hypothetical protein